MKAFDALRIPDTPEGKRDMSWIQNAHVALWLLKDFSWVSHWHWLGMAITVPTFALAVKIAYDSRRVTADLVHNVAVCFWICANITWMFGEFFYGDHTRTHAKVFFYAGLVTLAVYYAFTGIRRLNARYIRNQAASVRNR
jgi:hypothetical protein